MTRREMLAQLVPLDTWLSKLSDEEKADIRRVYGCSPTALYLKIKRAMEEPVVEKMTFGPDGKLTSVRYGE